MQNFWAKTSNPKHSFVTFGAEISYEKRVLKTFMKFTPAQTTKINALSFFLYMPVDLNL